MSGTVCEIIIRGNRTQALAASFKSAAPHGILPSADIAASLALTLCQLGTTSYDGKEVMTDAQQEQATVIMGEFNDHAAGYDASRPLDGPTLRSLDVALSIFNNRANSLIAEVLANT